MKLRNFLFSLLSPVLLASCLPITSAQEHRNAIADDSAGNLTVGTVQRKIAVGMSGAEVAAVLGSPNIVTSDEKRRETWIYDKISTEHVYSTSKDVGSILIFSGSQVRGAGAGSTTQKTLTVIIKFDQSGHVRDFAYNSSKF